MLSISILDGYVDEPTCLGVPPYICPYPRYIAGAVWCYDKHAQIFYYTIDQIRSDKSLLGILSNSDLVVVIAGMSVPGRYLSGFPVSPNELVSLLGSLKKPVKALCGPAARYGFGTSGGKKVIDTRVVENVFDMLVDGDGEIVISELLRNNLVYDTTDSSLCRSNPTDFKIFAVRGSKIVKQHPFFPDYLITEIETYRGCPRSLVGGCSFCSEPSKGSPNFRSIEDILGEISSLYTVGIRHFRIGNQPCIFSYMAKDADKQEFPTPNPDALEKLFKGIRTVAPDLKTLHVDNANPGVIARYSEECKRIAKSIIQYHTPGDVAAFGVESADPAVIKNNNLKASPDEVLVAIKLLNEVGSKRGSNGLPELLPGLNFVFGLKGETKNTFKLDYDFLKHIYDNGLLIRRINLRQVIPIPGTKMFTFGNKSVKRHKTEFQRFKRKVRKNIEQPMLKRMIPRGIILTDVYTEIYDGKLTFGRQVGSYPLLVGIPGVFPLHRFFDVKMVDYGYRSVTAIPYPLDINTASRETLEAIPDIGKRRTIRIMSKRPFKNKEKLIECFDDSEIGKKILKYINF
ncbi:MAG: radical SAM protein [Thermoplasmatales archaeon]|nr:MAG: radical SAM protein [Thermoplasmatales archaeon]